MLRSGHRVLRVVFEMPRILQLGTNLSEGGSSVENCHFGKSFFFFCFCFFLFLFNRVLSFCRLFVSFSPGAVGVLWFYVA